MARDVYPGDIHKYSYLRNELESLGLNTKKLNEFNDIKELDSLVRVIKESLLKQYRDSYQLAAT